MKKRFTTFCGRRMLVGYRDKERYFALAQTNLDRWFRRVLKTRNKTRRPIPARYPL